MTIVPLQKLSLEDCDMLGDNIVIAWRRDAMRRRQMRGRKRSHDHRSQSRRDERPR